MRTPDFPSFTTRTWPDQDRLLRHFLIGAITLLLARTSVVMLSTVVSEEELSRRERVYYALKSAEYFLISKVPLMITNDDGHAQPIEEVYPDDMGQTTMTCAIAAVTGVAPTRLMVKRLNVFINAACLLAFGLTLWGVGSKFAGLIVLLVGTWSVVPGPFPGAEGQAIYVGLYLLTLTSFVLMTVVPGRMGKPISGRIAAFLISIFCLAIAFIFRKPFGAIGVASIFLFECLSVRHHVMNKIQLLANLAVIGFCLFIASQGPRAIIKFRNTFFDVPHSSVGYYGHGIGHNVFIGLGLVPNSYGIRWDDSSGEKWIKKRYPEVPFMSDEYFSLIRKEYVKVVREHPYEVGKIYLKKATITLKTVGMNWIHFLLVVFSTIYLGRKIFLTPVAIEKSLAFGTGFSVILILLQGVIAWFIPEYIYPAKTGVLVFWVVLFTAAIKTGFLNQEPQKAASPENQAKGSL